MIRVTTVFTRPDTNVLFYYDAVTSYSAAIGAALINSPYVEAYSFSVAPDSLVATSVADFADQAALDAFLEELDPVVPFTSYIAEREAWCLQNNSSVVRTVTTI